MKILTYVTSRTYDTKEFVMYPDTVPVERDLKDVERLILEGHSIQWRKGTLIMDLTLSKFNSAVKPLFPDYTGYDPTEGDKKDYVSETQPETQKEEIKEETQKEEVKVTPEVSSEAQNAPVVESKSTKSTETKATKKESVTAKKSEPNVEIVKKTE